jgi:hypothetical protein
MERKSYILADRPGFGRIFDCGDCGNVHLTVGYVTITLDPQAYMQLVALVNTSAANFETWRHSRECQCCSESQTPKDIHAEDADPETGADHA